MLWLDQEGDVGTVEDVEGGRAWVEEGQGVVGNVSGFRHWRRGVDSIEVDTNELEEEKKKGEEKVSSPPEQLQCVEWLLQDLYCLQGGHHA